MVSAVYGSRISLTCSGSRGAPFRWRADNLSDISLTHVLGTDETWSSTIKFDAVETINNEWVECLTKNSEGAYSTVVKEFSLQIKSMHYLCTDRIKLP